MEASADGTEHGRFPLRVCCIERHACRRARAAGYVDNIQGRATATHPAPCGYLRSRRVPQELLLSLGRRLTSRNWSKGVDEPHLPSRSAGSSVNSVVGEVASFTDAPVCVPVRPCVYPGAAFIRAMASTKSHYCRRSREIWNNGQPEPLITGRSPIKCTSSLRRE